MASAPIGKGLNEEVIMRLCRPTIRLILGLACLRKQAIIRSGMARGSHCLQLRFQGRLGDGSGRRTRGRLEMAEHRRGRLGWGLHAPRISPGDYRHFTRVSLVPMLRLPIGRFFLQSGCGFATTTERRQIWTGGESYRFESSELFHGEFRGEAGISVPFLDVHSLILKGGVSSRGRTPVSSMPAWDSACVRPGTVGCRPETRRRRPGTACHRRHDPASGPPWSWEEPMMCPCASTPRSSPP